jgi:hypothetical protein
MTVLSVGSEYLEVLTLVKIMIVVFWVMTLKKLYLNST